MRAHVKLRQQVAARNSQTYPCKKCGEWKPLRKFVGGRRDPMVCTSCINAASRSVTDPPAHRQAEALSRRQEGKKKPSKAKLHKRIERMYQRRDQILDAMGYESYDEYLESDKWTGIRRFVLIQHAKVCGICGDAAMQIHHVNYSEANLSGQSTDSMVCLCRTCHESIEIRNGRKLSAWQSWIAFCNRVKDHKSNLSTDMADYFH